MSQRASDLVRKQGAVMAEVPLERVAVDHDPVLPPFPGEAIAEVLPIGVALGTQFGDDNRHLFQDPLKFSRKGVDRIGDKRLELIRLGLIHCPHVNQQPIGREMNRKVRAIGPLFAVLAIAVGGAVWSGCGGGGSDAESSATQAQEEIEAAGQKAEEAAKEGAEEAKKGIEQGAEKAKKGFEEAKEEVEKANSKKIKKTQKEIEEEVEKGGAKAEKHLEEAKEKAEKYLP